MQRQNRCGWMAAALACAAGMCGAGVYTFEAVAVSGTPAPGFGGGLYGNLSTVRPLLNNEGKVCFAATAGSTFPLPVGLFAGAAGSVLKFAATGEPAPGTGGATFGGTFGGFPTLTFDHQGNAAFAAQITGAGVAGTNDTGVWMASAGGTALCAREGSVAPGGQNNATFREFGLTSGATRIAMEGGVLLISGRLQGTGLTWDDGLWVSRGSGSTLAFREGGAAAGGGTYSGAFRPYVSPAGPVGVWVIFQGSANTFKGAWSVPYEFGGASFGAAGRVARANAGVPGQGGLTMEEIGAVDGATGGIGMIEARVSGAGVTSADNWRIYLGTAGGGLGEAARRASSSLAGPFAQLTVVFWSELRASSSGNVAFIATMEGPDVTGESDQALGVGSTAGGMYFVREGQQAEGCPTGVVYNSFRNVAINREGTVVFQSQLRGTGVNASNDQGIWAIHAGALELIVRESDVLEFGDGQFLACQLSTTALAGGSSENGLSCGLDDFGRVAFSADSASGVSGVFLAHPGLAACPGDFNGDRVVNFADLNIVLSGYGVGYFFNELNAVLSSFGATCP